MSEASIPVDLLNPGQVFACLGLMEAASVLLGGAEAAFDWTTPSQVRFVLRGLGDEDPVRSVLSFLANAEVVALMPNGSSTLPSWNKSWGPAVELPQSAPYPFPDPPSPATVAAALRYGGHELVFDHWGDQTHRDNVKFWAGAGGYPGAALLRDALSLVRARALEAFSDPFGLWAPQSSSFRLDWRRDYIPIDTGFSLNEHGGRIETVGYPLVEILGALGLAHARPLRITKLEYRYSVMGRADGTSTFFPPSWIRASLGDTDLLFPRRRFRMLLGWPGKEGQARAITTVTEESIS